MSYKTKKLEKQLTDPRLLVKSFGELARKVNQRIKERTSADDLAVLRTLPAARSHELTGDRKGELAVKISGNFQVNI